MCLLLIAYQAHPRYPLVVAANRDEFFARPTAPATFWDDKPGVLAGRDLVGGGTWLGVGPDARFAALTNYRDPSRVKTDAPSRGGLVTRFLAGNSPPERYLAGLRDEADRHNGFNLVFGTADSLGCYSNVDNRHRVIKPGVHGLSNHLLNTHWPKVVRGREGMAELLHLEGAELIRRLFDLLTERTFAPSADLPDTGVGPALERGLSPLFIRLPGYGTRSSTVTLIDREGEVTLVEKTYGEDGRESGLIR